MSGRAAEDLTVSNHKGLSGEHLVGPCHVHYAAGSCPSNSTATEDAGATPACVHHHPVMRWAFDRLCLELLEEFAQQRPPRRRITIRQHHHGGAMAMPECR